MKTKIYILLLMLLPLVSCNDWLDITPKGQTEASDLLSDEKGYNSALAGVYYILSDTTLYGRELSYGMSDLLAQYWDISNNIHHSMYQLAQYHYTETYASEKINAVWGKLYQGITQCNKILESLETNRNDIRYAGLIEGEALALRAFIHMELFAYFGPVIRNEADLDKPAIAYRTKFDVITLPFEPGREVLTKAKNDLLKALDLFKEDPILTNGRTQDGNTSLLDHQEVLNRRGNHMNYFAVLGLLARVELALLKPDEAYKYAERVIREGKNTGIFILSERSEMAAGSFADIPYTKEMLFSLYDNKLYDNTDYTFMIDGKGEGNKTFVINSNLYTTFVNEIYGRIPDGAGTDNRLRYWFEPASTDKSYYRITKFKKANLLGGIGYAYEPELPILRLSEIYYIACETQIGKNNTLALSYLNDVRQSRNLDPISGTPGNTELQDYLLRDARKEFIGEGRMFLMYKRLFAPIYVKAGMIIEPLAERFQLPIPEDEYEYSPNVKPGK